MTIATKGRVLVIDDMPDWLKLIRSILEDYDVVTVGTYEEAVQVIELLDFDVAILDIRLEDADTQNVDGLYLLQMIKQKKPSAGVVILTGHRNSIRERGLQAYQPFEFMEKGETFDNARLREAVRRLLGARRDCPLLKRAELKA